MKIINKNLGDEVENYDYPDTIYIKQNKYVCEDYLRPYSREIPYSIKEQVISIGYKKNIDMRKATQRKLDRLNKHIEDHNYIYKFKVKEIYHVANYIDMLIADS